MLDVITLHEKKKWEDCLKKCTDFDCYHTHRYHLISKRNGDGEPLLFSFERGDNIICFPLLKREIRDNSGDFHGYDFTSVYGYGGPIYSEALENGFVKQFCSAFEAYCKTNDILTTFSRLHPIIEQDFIFNNLGKVEKNSRTIQVDLTQSLEQQRKQYRKSNKSEINRLRKTATIVWSNNSEEDIQSFISIYEETMRRVNASEKYFFSKRYFDDLLSSDAFEAKLLFVERDGVKIAGAIFIFCENIIQYHLAGTITKFMKLTPMKLLLDEIRVFGTENGYSSFHMGGGSSGSDDDSLFRFKRGFSKIECDFKVFKYVVNERRYDQLSEQIKPGSDETTSKSFPRYR